MVYCFTLYFLFQTFQTLKKTKQSSGGYLELRCDPPRGQFNPRNYRHLLQNVIKPCLPQETFHSVPCQGKIGYLQRALQFCSRNSCKMRRACFNFPLILQVLKLKLQKECAAPLCLHQSLMFLEKQITRASVHFSLIPDHRKDNK